MSFFGSHLMKDFHLAAMLEFSNYYCQVDNSLPETHVRSINLFFIYLKFQYIIIGFAFNIEIAIFKVKCSYFAKSAYMYFRTLFPW